MIPHVIVLEPRLVILKVYDGYWFFGRPTIEELRQDLRAVLKRCRPDWDISKPELKGAWERDERSRFYPYGKTYGQVFRSQSSVIDLRLLSQSHFCQSYCSSLLICSRMLIKCLRRTDGVFPVIAQVSKERMLRTT
jgi:hypothetical protein